MKHAAKTRKEIGVRTAFNLLGPLSNPFEAKRQLMGVYEPLLVEKMARVLKELGCERGFVVHGVDGLDEVSTLGKTLLAEVSASGVRKRELVPEDFGLARAHPQDLAGGNSEENARIMVKLFLGEKCPRRDIVVANAAVGLIAAGKAAELKDAARKAEESLDSGKALKKLELLVRATKGNVDKLEALKTG